MTCQLLAGHQHAKHSMLTSEQHGREQAASGGPDISQLRPDLQAQWMHDKNKHLGNIAVTPHINRKVWWSCPDCPDGHAHIWEATVNARSNGTGCPYCSGQKVCKHNSLATKAPEIVRYWHPQKNVPLSPNTVTAHSHYKRTGSAQLATMSGRPQSITRHHRTVAGLSVEDPRAVATRMESRRSTLPLPAASIICCRSGITA